MSLKVHRRVAGGVEESIKLIDELVATLEKEQEDSYAEDDWCEAEFDKIEDPASPSRWHCRGQRVLGWHGNADESSLMWALALVRQ